MDIEYFDKDDIVSIFMKENEYEITSEHYVNLVKKYPEFEHIEMFNKIAEQAFNHFKESHMCSFMASEDEFFSLIDCTFRGYSATLFITAEDEYIYNYPLLNYDRSCMLYIEIPEDFDENPDKYKKEFIHDAILTIAENYVIVSQEDADGLSGKTLPNPNYIGDD